MSGNSGFKPGLTGGQEGKIFKWEGSSILYITYRDMSPKYFYMYADLLLYSLVLTHVKEMFGCICTQHIGERRKCIPTHVKCNIQKF